MNLFRRIFDPILSRRIFRLTNSASILQQQSLSIHLRLDDPYSYLLAQTLPPLCKIVSDNLYPIRFVMHAAQPNAAERAALLQYQFKDAQVVAQQHGFSFPGIIDALNDSPSTATEFYHRHLTADIITQATQVIEYYSHTLPLDEFSHQLQQVMAMVWHGQTIKLDILHSAITQPNEHVAPTSYSLSCIPTTINDGHFRYAGKPYSGIDDLLRLTRRLNKDKHLTGEPIFLMDHLEWGEHLVSDPIELSYIHAAAATLTVYIALEDPFSWLILYYLEHHIAGYYNVKITICPINFQHKDTFDWRKAIRLSKRVKAPFTPFCRPNAEAAQAIAELIYPLAPTDRLDALLWLYHRIWREGLDITRRKHYAKSQQYIFNKYLADANDASKHSATNADTADAVTAWLADNTHAWHSTGVPLLPTMSLQVNTHSIPCGGIYRVWQIETALAAGMDTPHA